MLTVKCIPAFNDNYIWLIQGNDYCAVVDPGDSQPVIAELQKHNIALTDILITHHHADHIGGVQDLIKRYPKINIYGPNSKRFNFVTHPCSEGDVITLGNSTDNLRIVELHGHTIDHIGFICEKQIFVGDTLFSVGCGRLFEGTAEQLFNSLQSLSKLPGDTLVYCAHEYTMANIKFAEHIMPNNTNLQKYKQLAKQKLANDEPTIPFELETQISVNPFLNLTNKELKLSIAQHFDVPETLDELQTFTLCRKWKDTF